MSGFLEPRTSSTRLHQGFLFDLGQAGIPTGWRDLARKIDKVCAPPYCSAGHHATLLRALVEVAKLADGPWMVTSDTLMDLGRQLKEPRLVRGEMRVRSDSTVNGLLRCVRRLLSLCVKERWIERTPFADSTPFLRERRTKAVDRFHSLEALGLVFDRADREAGVGSREWGVGNSGMAEYRPAVSVVTGVDQTGGQSDAAEGRRVERSVLASDGPAPPSIAPSRLGYHGARAHWKAMRSRALLYLVAHCGLRAGEALHLRRECIDLADGTLGVIDEEGDGGWRAKTTAANQRVPIPDDALAPLAEWMALPLNEGKRWVFRQWGADQPWIGGASGYRPVSAIKQLGERAGVVGLTLKSLRHSWATHAASKFGLSPKAIQQVLRHTTLGTQAWYCHADLQNLKACMKGLRFPRGPSNE